MLFGFNHTVNSSLQHWLQNDDPQLCQVHGAHGIMALKQRWCASQTTLRVLVKAHEKRRNGFHRTSSRCDFDEETEKATPLVERTKRENAKFGHAALCIHICNVMLTKESFLLLLCRHDEPMALCTRSHYDSYTLKVVYAKTEHHFSSALYVRCA